MPKTKSTVYFTKITTWKAGKNLKFWERKTPGWSLACLLACLPDTDKEIFRVSLLKTVCCFLPIKLCNFAYVVLPTLFFPVNSTWLSLEWICQVIVFKVFIILPPVWLSNLGSDLSIDNIVWLGLADTKSGSQNAVKKVLELTEKWKYPNFRGKF